MRIMVIGYSGSGKSTLAKFLAKTYNLPLLYLDKIAWEANWVYVDENKQQELLIQFLNNNDDWVIDGNYSSNNFEKRLELADKIYFLNFNRFTCYKRAKKRAKLLSNSYRESITEGCYEKFDFEFRKWILFDGRNKKHKNTYMNIVTKYKDKVIVLKKQKDLDKIYQELYHEKNK